jgi:hypothetical protein
MNIATHSVANYVILFRNVFDKNVKEANKLMTSCGKTRK